MLIFVILDGVYNAGDGNECTYHGCVLLFFLIEPEFISLGGIVFFTANTVICIRQIGWNRLGVYARLSSLYLFGTKYVCIVRDTSVFLVYEIICIKKKLNIVSVPQIASEDTVCKVFRCLMLVVASR